MFKILKSAKVDVSLSMSTSIYLIMPRDNRKVKQLLEYEKTTFEYRVDKVFIESKVLQQSY